MKRTALHRASLEGHAALVQMLLEKGADINFKDQVRHTGTLLVCKDDGEIGQDYLHTLKLQTVVA